MIGKKRGISLPPQMHSTRVSNAGSKKNGALYRSRPLVVTTRCTVDLNSPFDQRYRGSRARGEEEKKEEKKDEKEREGEGTLVSPTSRA